MIVCLIIIIIVLLIILCIWWVYRNNNYNCNKNLFKNSITSLNSHLQHAQMIPAASMYKPMPMPKYIGSIDDSIDEINKSILNKTLETNSALINGHRDLKKNENCDAPIGNIANVTATSAPYAPAIPSYTAENNTHDIDFDESNAFQGLARNDPLRPTIGIIDRGSMMDAFLREELADAEDKEWWGNGEY
jgi:hypothetical protein